MLQRWKWSRFCSIDDSFLDFFFGADNYFVFPPVSIKFGPKWSNNLPFQAFPLIAKLMYKLYSSIAFPFIRKNVGSVQQYLANWYSHSKNVMFTWRDAHTKHKNVIRSPSLQFVFAKTATYPSLKIYHEKNSLETCHVRVHKVYKMTGAEW